MVRPSAAPAFLLARSTVATLLCPPVPAPAPCPAALAALGSRVSTGTSLSSLTLEAQPASSAVVAAASSRLRPKGRRIGFIEGSPANRKKGGQRPEGPQTG